jgi:hypothetical protein
MGHAGKSQEPAKTAIIRDRPAGGCGCRPADSVRRLTPQFAIHTTREIAALTLNLYDVEILRGGTADTPVHLPPLPRKLDEVRVILPRFAEAGRYSIAVLKSRETGSAIALASGTASSKRGKIELTVRLDLSAAPPGQYLLGTRLDDNQTTFYYPVTVI